MTVSMRVMSAGHGYRYLLSTVAVGDGQRTSGTPLTAYYTADGTPPGRWLGSGLAGLGDGRIRAGDVVEEAQLALLLAIALTGYMSKSGVLASAAAAEPLGFTVEVLLDATRAIPLSNEVGAASAAQVHETLMTPLNANWAAVTSTADWIAAKQEGTTVARSNLVESAVAGRTTT